MAFLVALFHVFSSSIFSSSGVCVYLCVCVHVCVCVFVCVYGIYMWMCVAYTCGCVWHVCVHSHLCGGCVVYVRRYRCVHMFLCSLFYRFFLFLLISPPIPLSQEPLRMLLKQLVPWFYSYLAATEGGLTLMFCHRWLLVCLKREFSEPDTLAIWEACWSNYETNSFHLFVCVAIMAVYGQRAVYKHMHINELMVFFNTLSLTMPRDLVLSQARGYLHQFSTSATAHCSLSPLMPSSFWEQPSSPRLMCSVCKGLTSACTSSNFPTSNTAAIC